jgi:hypothetical protein
VNSEPKFTVAAVAILLALSVLSWLVFGDGLETLKGLL